MIRSALFVPADSKEKLNKAMKYDADCLFVDLEDSVSLGNKEKAREIAREFVENNRNDGKLIYVRINALDSGESDDDLKTIMIAKPHGIVLPKSKSGADVTQLDAQLRVLEAENNIKDGQTRIIAIVTESAQAVLQTAQYRGASPRLEAMTWGAEDLAADIGVAEKRDGYGKYREVFQFARIQTLLGAIAANVQPIDGIYDDFEDVRGLKKECEEAVKDGFIGKMAIHPKQVPIINKAFTPAKTDVEKAKKIIKTFEKENNAGVIAMDGKMLDQPHLKQAHNVIKRSKIK